MTYDVFISYRRDAFESANLFATRLKALGYRVFFDVETMNAGKFNEQLLDVISKCKDFVLVLSPNALNRCNDKDDWVRRETLYAMECNKNIIPIMLSGFVWPDKMPEGMEELCNYQSLAPAPNTYYDLQIKRLAGYLKSKAHIKLIQKWIIGVGVFAFVVAVLMLIAHLTYMPFAQQIADNMTIQTQCMNDLSCMVVSSQSELEAFVKEHKGKQPSDPEKDEFQQLILNKIKLDRKQKEKLFQLCKNNPVEAFGIHLPLLWIHGISPAALLINDSYVENVFADYDDLLEKYENLVEQGDYSIIKTEFVALNTKVLQASISMHYYDYLHSLTHLPESTHEQFYVASPMWHYLPKAGIGLSDKEYERLIRQEADVADDALKSYKALLKSVESEKEE